jgi:hypothetical protein
MAGDRSASAEIRRALVAHVRRERERMSLERPMPTDDP